MKYRLQNNARAALALVVLVLSIISSPAQASTLDWGMVSNVIAHRGTFFFTTSGARTTVPTCAIVYTRWAIDTSTQQGQAVVAALLTAYMAHKRIKVDGTGTCDVWADTESVQYFQIED